MVFRLRSSQVLFFDFLSFRSWQYSVRFPDRFWGTNLLAQPTLRGPPPAAVADFKESQSIICAAPLKRSA